jgi:hypothetical protein
MTAPLEQPRGQASRRRRTTTLAKTASTRSASPPLLVRNKKWMVTVSTPPSKMVKKLCGQGANERAEPLHIVSWMRSKMCVLFVAIAQAFRVGTGAHSSHWHR